MLQMLVTPYHQPGLYCTVQVYCVQVYCAARPGASCTARAARDQSVDREQ